MPEGDAPEGGGGFTPIATQDELDRRVGERLARERAKFADYDELKAKAAKLDEVEAANKSELQKAQDAIAERDAKLADLPKQVRSQVLRFASIANTKGFLDPEDALLFIDSHVDLADQAAVESALDELATRKPHLVKAAKKLPAKPKPGSGDTTSDEDGDLSAMKGKERAAAALRQFRSTR